MISFYLEVIFFIRRILLSQIKDFTFLLLIFGIVIMFHFYKHGFNGNSNHWPRVGAPRIYHVDKIDSITRLITLGAPCNREAGVNTSHLYVLRACRWSGYFFFFCILWTNPFASLSRLSFGQYRTTAAPQSSSFDCFE